MAEKNVEYLYDHYRFGDFNFDPQRSGYHELLFKEFFPQINENDQVYDIGCGGQPRNGSSPSFGIFFQRFRKFLAC